MIVNGQALLDAAPIRDMISTKEKAGGTSFGLSEAGYDIRIKQDINFDRQTVWIREPGLGQFWKPIYNSRFIIASAIEEFQMPDDLVGIVHDKSTWARQGISVFNTVIESGWKGFLTLEIVNHGGPIMIPAGSGIAQVIFHKTTCKSLYSGKYQNQEDKPVDSKFE